MPENRAPGPLGKLLGTFRQKGLVGLLARSSSSAFILHLLGTMAGFLLQWMLARILKVDRFGIYVTCLAWLRLLLLPARLGFEHASLRFVAAYAVKEQWGLLRGYLIRSHQVLLGTSFLVAALTAGVSWTLRQRLGQELTDTILVACLILPLQTWLGLQVGCLRGFKEIPVSLGARDLALPLSIVALVGAASLLGVELTAPGAMGLNLIGTFMVVVGTTTMLLRRAPVEVRRARSEYETREWFGVALSIALMGSFTLLLKQTDTVMVSVLVGTTEAGIYAVAARIALFIAFGINSVNAIMGPMISQLYASEDMGELQRLVTISARMIFVFTVVFSAGILVAATPVLSIFGEGFSRGAPVLRVLVASQAVNALAGSVGLLMTMTGSQVQAARIMAVTAVLNLVLNFAMIPAFGMIGAAIATLISTTLSNVAMIVMVRRTLGINPLVKW